MSASSSSQVIVGFLVLAKLMEGAQVVQRIEDIFNIVPKLSKTMVARFTNPTSELLCLMAMIYNKISLFATALTFLVYRLWKLNSVPFTPLSVDPIALLTMRIQTVSFLLVSAKGS